MASSAKRKNITAGEEPVNNKEGKRSGVSTITGDDSKRIHELRGFLECPVCLSFPRRSPSFCKETMVYSCNNGHIVCGFCFTALNALSAEMNIRAHNKCPTCREEELLPSRAAGKVLEMLMMGKLVQCRNEVHGCDKNIPWEAIWYHEISCPQREVSCISAHRDSCGWKGTLPNLIRHIKENDCAQIVKTANSDGLTFTSNLANFADTRTSVFQMDTTVHWRPALLVSEKLITYLIYVTVKRTTEGDWYIAVRSISPQHVREKITYELQIFQGSAEEGQAKCSWNGYPVSHNHSDYDLIRTGEYLRLNDSQLRNLTRNLSIFEYQLRFQLGC